jgi:uncharacterized membrane protein required for colicin V production
VDFTAFDLLIALALLAMFVVGYAQGIIRRLLGIAAIIFSLILAAQVRAPLGEYLAKEWNTLSPDYSYMVAFGAVFVAAAAAISIGIQITYRPAPLLPRYPVLDEIIGGLLGILEGIIILMAIFMILDPYFSQPSVAAAAPPGEFGPLRALHDLLDNTLTADIMRHSIIPAVLAVFGILFPQDVRDTFAAVLLARA